MAYCSHLKEAGYNGTGTITQNIITKNCTILSCKDNKYLKGNLLHTAVAMTEFLLSGGKTNHQL